MKADSNSFKAHCQWLMTRWPITRLLAHPTALVWDHHRNIESLNIPLSNDPQ